MLALQRADRGVALNSHAEKLRVIALATPLHFDALHAAADYLDAHDYLANECRRKVEIQTNLRVEAQARAARLSRDARR